MPELFLNRKYQWNQHGVCVNPFVFDFGHHGKCHCRISMAEDDTSAYYGYDYGYCTNTEQHGHCGCAPIKNCQRFHTPFEAVTAGLREAIDFFSDKPDEKFLSRLVLQLESIEQTRHLPEPIEFMQQTNIIDADTGKELPMEETGSNNPQTSMAVAARATAISPLDVESAQRISGLYAEALHGLRKVVFCGAEMLEQKARMKHGQFLPWLESNCPEIPARTAQQFMACAEAAVCLGLNKKSYSQIRNDCVFDNMPISKILQLPSAELPPAAAKAQEQIFELVDGKTQKQLLFDFRDSEPAKRKYNPPVRTKGELAQIKQAADEQIVKDVTESLLMLDNQKLARCSDETLKALRGALDYVKGRLPRGK